MEKAGRADRHSSGRVEPFLQRLPVDALWGVGPVTAEKLRARGIHRLVDVRTFDDQALRQAVGSMAEWLKQLANGIDDVQSWLIEKQNRPVQRTRIQKI